jgi:membrane peptidoglycan carboxypeptidase
MAIVDTVWGRLTRFNVPLRRRDDRSAVASPWISDAIGWTVMASAVVIAAMMTLSAVVRERLFRPDASRAAWQRYRKRSHLVIAIRRVRWVLLACALLVIGWVAWQEMRTSHLQAMLFTRLADSMTFGVSDGPSKAIAFPKSGPYDNRLGYVALPEFINALTAHRYAIESQAQWSPGLARFVTDGGFPIYPEKDQAGLRIFDRSGGQLYQARFPQRAYANFASIPGLVVDTLLFIEDRYLLDRENPERNPAIEWNRFGLAAVSRIAGLFVPGLHAGGGSTLATQIEKFRHSPHGLTGGVAEKLRQMLSASVRAYYYGPDTLRRRQQIVTTYLNSTPLASMPGFGEIIGLPEALWIWFGTDYVEASKILGEKPRTAAALARKGEIYRQVLSLLLSERRPSYYLLGDHAGLATLTDKHLGALYSAGVIDAALRDAALDAKLQFRTEPPPFAATSYVQNKAAEDVRNRLVGILDLPDLYALDRLDLTAETSVDSAAQTRVAAVMQRLSDPKFLREQGLIGKGLLGDGDPSKVTWSFVLYERGAGRNHLRIHADSLNAPFDINSGAKLQLGSTAKLRTLVTYLQIIADLHERLAAMPSRDLARLAAADSDPLTDWAARYLARTTDRRLQPMLDAAMQRHYSAAPQQFFTGGGTQSFANFEKSEDYENPTVQSAFERSVNLSFVRLLRDIASYYTAASGVQVSRLLGNPDDPRRDVYLQRFVNADSRRFLYRFYEDYKGLNSAEALDLLARRTRPVPKKLAAVYLSVHPDARLAHFYAFLAAHLPHLNLTEQELWDNYLSYSPERMSLADRGYVSGVHPLELWLVRYLQEHPGASWKQVLDASTDVRREVYSWLLDGSAAKQNLRIRILIEQDAFNRILENWHKLGYPFGHLVPSLGTAIGASGDRPQALAELMGIILNGGVRVPSASIERLRFASNTPYETNLGPAGKPERVMPVEVAQTVERALVGVVAEGTARRLNGTYTAANGAPLVVGGKTGTGDNRYERFSAGGGLLSSRAVDRTATFVFFLGDRFFGTVTAYVPGEDADHFNFTSALAVQLLKALEPELKPLIDGPAAAEQAMVGSSRP